MNTPIEERIIFDTSYDNFTRQFIGIAYDYYTGDVYAKIRQKSALWLNQNLRNAVSQFLKEWKCQDQTSSMELKSRKIIISECGQLRVQESLSLMETCSPTS